MQMSEISGVLCTQILHCLAVLASFIVPALMILIPIRFLTKLPSYVFRKLLHIVAFSCVTLMILSAKSWQAAALTSVLIAVAVYPILAALESAPWFEKLFVQKSAGEIKKSLLLLFFMFAALISVSWGVFGKPHLAAAAILMFISGMIVLSAVQKTALPQAALSAGLGALLGTVTELFSPSEYDTVTVPAVIAAVLLLLG